VIEPGDIGSVAPDHPNWAPCAVSVSMRTAPCSAR